MKRIDTESLQKFLLSEVPGFRNECLRGRLTLGSIDNFYHLLMDFQKHVGRLHAEDPHSEAFVNALRTIDKLLTHGTDSVRDAVTIQIIDVIIKDEALRTASAASQFPALVSAIDRQISNWAEFRRLRKAELTRERESF